MGGEFIVKENKYPSIMIALYMLFVRYITRALKSMNKSVSLAYAMGREQAIAFGMDRRAFSTSLVGAALGIVILAIIVLDVAIPVVQDAIATANLTGTTLTIANLIPMFFVLGLFVMVAVVFVIRWL